MSHHSRCRPVRHYITRAWRGVDCRGTLHRSIRTGRTCSELTFSSPSAFNNLQKQKQKNQSQTSVPNISVEISIQPCNASCSFDDNTEITKNLLFSGSYNPVVHEPSKPGYQNFTLSVDSSTLTGDATISVRLFRRFVSQCFFGGAPPVDQKMIIF